jgi:hypothetical protein
MPIAAGAVTYDEEWEITDVSPASISVGSGNVRIHTSAPVTRSGFITINNPDGATIYFDCDLTYTGNPVNDFVTFTNTGKIVIDDSHIYGETDANLVMIEPGFTSVSITGSVISNTNDNGYAININSPTTLTNCTISSYLDAVTINSPTTINSCTLSTTNPPSTASQVSTVTAYDSLIIDGNTNISSVLLADESIGIYFYAPGGLLQIKNGNIYGGHWGIFHIEGDMTISGGTIWSEHDDVIYSRNAVPGDVLTISGGKIESKDGKYNGIEIQQDSELEIVMTSGEVSGTNGISVYTFTEHKTKNKITISGGKVIAKNSGNSAAVVSKGITALIIESGAEIIGNSAQPGIWFTNADATIKMTGGSVSGNVGIRAEKAAKVELLGGTITATASTGDAAVLIEGATETVIGGATLVGGDYGVHLNNATATLSMTDGDISAADHGIYAEQAFEISLSGGEIAGGPDSTDAGVSIAGDTGLAISGADIESAGYGVILNNIDAELSMTDGTVKGAHGINAQATYEMAISGGKVTSNSALGTAIVSKALYLSVSGGEILGHNGLYIDNAASQTLITGGSFITTGATTGYGIQPYLGALDIAPDPGSSILVRGGACALVGDDIDYYGIAYYYTSTSHDGTGKKLYRQSVDPFVNNIDFYTGYKYVEFLSSAPSYKVSVIGGKINGKTSDNVPVDSTANIVVNTSTGRRFLGWTASGIDLADPTQAAQAFTMPYNDVTLTAVFEDIIGGSNPGNPGGSGNPGGGSGGSGGGSGGSGNTPPSVPSVTSPVAKEKSGSILVIATLNDSGRDRKSVV